MASENKEYIRNGAGEIGIKKWIFWEIFFEVVGESVKQGKNITLKLQYNSNLLSRPIFTHFFPLNSQFKFLCFRSLSALYTHKTILHFCCTFISCRISSKECSFAWFWFRSVFCSPSPSPPLISHATAHLTTMIFASLIFLACSLARSMD